MLLIIFLALIGIAIVGLFLKDRSYFHFNLFFGLMLGALFGLFSSLIAGLIVESIIPKQWVEVETIELISLRDSENISGRHFLGTGSIGTKQYYFFYKKAGKGYQPGKIEVDDNIIIFEENRTNGEIKKYKEKFIDSPRYRSWRLISFMTMPRNEKYEFFIPEGSLKKDFTLD